jgi:hypothetical protein
MRIRKQLANNGKILSLEKTVTLLFIKMSYRTIYFLFVLLSAPTSNISYMQGSTHSINYAFDHNLQVLPYHYTCMYIHQRIYVGKSNLL